MSVFLEFTCPVLVEYFDDWRIVLNVKQLTKMIMRGSNNGLIMVTDGKGGDNLQLEIILLRPWMNVFIKFHINLCSICQS